MVNSGESKGALSMANATTCISVNRRIDLDENSRHIRYTAVDTTDRSSAVLHRLVLGTFLLCGASAVVGSGGCQLSAQRSGLWLIEGALDEFSRVTIPGITQIIPF